jgi:hypothetical protein
MGYVENADNPTPEGIIMMKGICDANPVTLNISSKILVNEPVAMRRLIVLFKKLN